MSNTNNPVALRSISVTVTANEVQFVFRNRPNFCRPYFGGLYAYLAQAIPSGTTSTLPVSFTTDGGNAANLTTYNGENVTVADIAGTGVFLVWVDSQSGTVQLLTGIV